MTLLLPWLLTRRLLSLTLGLTGLGLRLLWRILAAIAGWLSLQSRIGCALLTGLPVLGLLALTLRILIARLARLAVLRRPGLALCGLCGLLRLLLTLLPRLAGACLTWILRWCFAAIAGWLGRAFSVLGIAVLLPRLIRGGLGLSGRVGLRLPRLGRLRLPRLGRLRLPRLAGLGLLGSGL